MSLTSAFKPLVENRAESRWEYCGMRQSLQGGKFHIEHIRPIAQGGASDLDNLALACPGCNLRKSDRVMVLDDETQANVPIFNPRIDTWPDHFQWNGYEVAGRTAVGRATIAQLDMNHARRIQIRRAEEFFGLFPPILRPRPK